MKKFWNFLIILGHFAREDEPHWTADEGTRNWSRGNERSINFVPEKPSTGNTLFINNLSVLDFFRFSWVKSNLYLCCFTEEKYIFGWRRADRPMGHIHKATQPPGRWSPTRVSRMARTPWAPLHSAWCFLILRSSFLLNFWLNSINC